MSEDAWILAIAIVGGCLFITKAVEEAARKLAERIDNLSQITHDHTQAVKNLEWERRERESPPNYL